MTRVRRRLVAAVVAGSALVVTGCTTLPTGGPVHTRADSSASSINQAPYFAPPGPADGADPESIASGFLLALQANPPSTAVARSFLVDAAKATWKPAQGTIVYDGSSFSQDGTAVSARLTGAHRLDERGGWVPGPTTTVDLGFRMVLQDGQWRIADPPTSLPVPTSYFRSLYAPYTLYFFDRTGTVLVPTPIYLPRGAQIATNLVRGLLTGPGLALDALTQSAVRSGIGLVGAVVTNDEGLAEVPFGPEIQRIPAADLHRLVQQVAWTLSQVPGITRLRVTADGIPLPMAGGQADVSLVDGLQYDPVSAPVGGVAGLVGGKVVTISGTGTQPTSGPLGQPGYSLRSVAHSIPGHQYAVVSGNGTRVFEASDYAGGDAGVVRTVLSGAENLLRPAYDRFGNLWVVDARRAGAVVHLISGARDRVLEVPGISGRRISSFVVTRDGARLVAGLSTAGTSVVVAGIVRADRGRVVRVLGAEPINAEGLDAGPVLDLGQDSGTTVSVLTRATSGIRRILVIELDGSVGFQTATPDPIPEPLDSLLLSPDPRLPREAVSSDHQLLELDTRGQWVHVASGVLAASYPQ